jgi:hypothetical protein
MAESKSRKSKESKSSSNKSSSSKSSGSRNSRPSTREIAESAVEQVHDLIGRPVESITGVQRDGDEWTVTLEVLELERVPMTTDVLGSYEVTMDRDGELVGTQRTRRYPRAEAGEG